MRRAGAARRRVTAVALALAVLPPLVACDRAQRAKTPTGTKAAAVAPIAPLTITAEGAEKQFLAALNHRRRILGLGPLASDPRMVPVARAWAARMRDAGGISHNPDLRSQVPADWRKYGENVGVGDTVASLHEAFLASPHHYVNIADREFNTVGVGVVMQGRLIWVVFDFLASPAGAGPGPPGHT